MRRRASVLACALGAALAMNDYSQAGPMRVGWRKLLIKPPSGLEFEAMVVYPGLQIGWEAPQDVSGAPYPIVLFGHGYSTNPDAYMSTLQHIASWGMVVVAPEVTAVHHLRYANEISVTISHMEREQLHESGQFYKMLDLQHIGGYAHTAGAGCLLLCAAKDPRIKTLVLAAPLETMPSSVNAAKEVRVPINVIVAKDDWLASPDKGAVPIYKAANTPKQLHVVTGGSNAYFYDGDGQHRARQLRVVRHLATSFLLLYLKKDAAAWPCVWGSDMLNNSKVWSVADRGAPGQLLKRAPAASAVEMLQEDVFSDPRSPQKLQKEFAPPGPFVVGATNVTRLTRNRQLFSASVWYPATKTGTDTPLDLSRAPYPVVVFAHGWFQLPEGYKTILEHVASHGYIVIGSRANKELYGDQFALSLSWCVDFLCDQAAIPASRWHQVPDCHRVGALGHSVGAGAATLAVADDVRFKALVLLSPAEVFPSAVTAAARAHTPLLVLAAPDDLTDGAHKIALPLYEAVHAPKQLHLLKNGSGQFFADGMLLGKRHRKQLRTTAQMAHAFFDTYLRARLQGYEQAWRGLWDADALAPRDRSVLFSRGFGLQLLPHHIPHDGDIHHSGDAADPRHVEVPPDGQSGVAEKAHLVNGSTADAARAAAEEARSGAAERKENQTFAELAAASAADGDAANAAAAAGLGYTTADTSAAECRWSLKVNNTLGERTQLDLSVRGNEWSVLCPERTPVLAPGAVWFFDVVEQLPFARAKTQDEFDLWACPRLDGATCARAKLTCSRDQTLQHVVVDEHGWTI